MRRYEQPGPAVGNCKEPVMKRLSYIDRVKGLLVISVVLGHAAWSIGLMDYNYPYVCYPFNTTAFLYVGIFMTLIIFCCTKRPINILLGKR